MQETPEMIPLSTYRAFPTEEMLIRSAEFADFLRRRRTGRHFSDRPVSRELIENCIRAAGTAPSGANMQPWRFVIISNPEVKHTIRLAAEEEERDFYTHRAPKEWLEALAPLGTDSEKPFLETAPYLIAIFAEKNGTLPDGRSVKHYYVAESVGIATGMLITALHHAGLVSLTHTPSPMNFLNEILSRPSNEKPFLLLVVGYPADDAFVPNIQRKTLDEIALFIE
jgi:iodotyrosine deiodinase